MATFDELVCDQLQQHRDILLQMNYSKAAAETEAEAEQTQHHSRPEPAQPTDNGTTGHQ